MERDRSFHKWEEFDDRSTQGQGGASVGQDHPAGPSKRSRMWMFRIAWVVSTGMLLSGALLIVLILAGQGHWIGL